MLFNALDKLRRNALLTTILLITLGVIILLVPEMYIPTMVITLGYLLVIAAIVIGLDFFFSDKSILDYLKFVFALGVLIAGVVVLVYRDDTLNIMAWLFGLFMVADGLGTLFHSLTYARRSRRKGWWVLTILSFPIAAAGVLLFINPWFVDTNTLMKAIGLAVLFMAIVSGMRLIWMWPVKKEKEETQNV